LVKSSIVSSTFNSIAFKSNEDEKHKTLLNLKGAFLREEKKFKSDDGAHDIFQINISFANKDRQFYVITKVF
jgi:hypothetical protein